MHMYVCICMYVYVCMYMYASICMYMYVCMCVYVCMYVCMYMCVCIHVYVCMHNISGELSGRVNVLPKMGGEIVRGGIVRGGIILHSRVDVINGWPHNCLSVTLRLPTPALQ